MISKELLSEVLKESVLSIRPYIEDDIIDENITIYECGKNTYGIIDIYELAHKCKQWALEHDCELLSCIRSKDRAICDIYSDKYNCKFTHYADTEPEAIFKACKWIMENKCGS